MSTVEKDIEKLSVPVWSGSGKASEYERWSILVKIRLEGKEIDGALGADWSAHTDDDKKKAAWSK